MDHCFSRASCRPAPDRKRVAGTARSPSEPCTHRFRGRCGSPIQPVDWEMAVQCHQCGHRCYPRVSPCTIVAVYRGKEILLARGVRHSNPKMYSIIAGFVESGESVEQATHREVGEEVGVKIKNLEYFVNNLQ